eukprot:CAMPEP_0169070926 /NCGR_PEP_ID=MMETSP1015-20121227/5384_1 /TAXON_ID=342587 /ORGANISM="Karlodinium micrum, Strain CCMP2283" /LENGTH=872 /DNA_ID=CAMNT_0009129973 /DNA_START=86 /DNA_END=2704 /DNA_ORIENTATION=+
MAYAPGMEVQVLSPMVMREEEELSSAESRHLAEGDICTVVAIGVGDTGRRIKVTLTSLWPASCEGWISVTSASGKQLICQAPTKSSAPSTATSAPPASRPSPQRQETLESKPPPPLPPPALPPASAVLQPLASQSTKLETKPPVVPPASSPPPLVQQQSGMIGLPAPPSAPLMGLPEAEPRLNECFEIGADVKAIDKMILREAEDFNSADICELEIGTEFTVRARGSGPTGRRLMVMVNNTGQVGWISCFSQSGNRLLDVVPPPATAAATLVVQQSKPNAAYPIGSHIITGDPARMRADEDLRSMEIMELPAGTELVVLEHGAGEDGRRILVCTARTGTRGWISCCSASGKALVQFAPEEDILPPLSRMSQAGPMPEIPQAPPGVARASDNGFQMPPGYENGTWHYICVDPTGVRLRDIAEYAKKNKTGQELVYGDMVTINFRGREDKINWLALSDHRGFAMERTNRRRMSEVIYESILPDRRTFIVRPQLKSSLPLALTPIIPLASSSKNLQQVVPGMLVQKRRSATVILQAPNDKYKDLPSVFIEVFDPSGNVGWIPERTSTGEQVLVEPERELLPPPLNWITVLNTTNAKSTTCPGSPVASWQRLPAGEFLEVSEVLTVGGQRYFKMAAEDAWVCEAPLEENGKRVVELVTVEQHWWAYVCDDKTGAAIRLTPTRVKSTKTGQLLKHRQRVVSTDIAIMQSGEEYIHLGPPFAGWVPTTKVSGTPKMQALNPVPPSKGAWAGGKYPIQKRPPMPAKERQPMVWNAFSKTKVKQPKLPWKSQSQPAPVSQPQPIVSHHPRETSYGAQVSQNDGDFNHPLPIRRSLGGTPQETQATMGYQGITAAQLGVGVHLVPTHGAPQAPSNFWPARY